MSVIVTVLFWLGQVVVAPIVILVWVFTRESAIKRKYNIPDKQQLEVKDAAHWVIFALILIAHGGYQSFARVNFHRHWLDLLVAGLLTLINAFYVFLIAISSEAGDVISATEETERPYDVVDENDRLLIRLQTEMSVFERRVEAYTIESTLIGALAFSAFVTIVSSDKGSLTGVSALLVDVSDIARLILAANFAALRKVVSQPPSEHTVLAAIACLALVCSMLFVAVIVARLRFNSLVGIAHYSTEIAAAFNRKEEEIAREILVSSKHRSDAVEQRLDRLRQQISDSLEQTQVAVDQLRPIIAYMGIFRHCGVLTFLAALVASALWVSPMLAISLALIGTLAYVYPTLDRWVRDSALRKHDFFRLPSLIKRRRS